MVGVNCMNNVKANIIAIIIKNIFTIVLVKPIEAVSFCVSCIYFVLISILYIVMMLWSNLYGVDRLY